MEIALPTEGTAVSLRDISKSFGGVRALAEANLDVTTGTIHGLVGQNGAGKSTLIKVLAGLCAPDSGTISVYGTKQTHLTPQRVEALGIHFIHQDRLLPPSLTVGEALLLGHEITVSRFLPLLNRRAMQRRASEILRSYFDIALPPGALISELTTAQKQIVQITRALLSNPRILVFDEPTAALVRREADILFALIRRLRAEGITVIYISHYLAEIEALCDTVTVLRNGRDVATVDPHRTPAVAIARLMVERDIENMFPKRKVPIGPPALTVSRLGRRGYFDEVSLTLRRGEILGLTGLVGSGAKDVVRCLFGLNHADEGEIRLGDASQGVALRAPAEAVSRGVALIPEDRRGHGVALGLSVAENMTLASLERISRFGFLRRREEGSRVEGLIKALSVRTSSARAPVRTLSGGNQQKVSVAKWLSRDSAIYILDEPTVGIDVGSKVEIYDLIGTLAEKGAAILILSTDLPELLGIADRILVMYRGCIVREVEPQSTTEAGLLSEITGSGELRDVG
jgi:ribose transport system ATP-binding protein